MFSIEGLISLPNGENCNIIYIVWDILKIQKASTYYIKTYKRLLSNLRHIHVFFPDYEPIGYFFSFSYLLYLTNFIDIYNRGRIIPSNDTSMSFMKTCINFRFKTYC